MQIRSSKGWGRLYRTVARAFAGVKLNKSESRVLWAIVYKTIAFNKLEDSIPWSQLSELTGIKEWNLTKPINSLLKKGVIFRKGSIYGVQIDFSKWKIPSNQMVIEESPSIRKESPSIRKESPSLEMVSRDLSKRAFQKKGLSTQEREKKRKEYKTGLEMLKEAIKRNPDRKRKN
ncbi:hypothetical protein ES708_25093 [subsurface metagenome]